MVREQLRIQEGRNPKLDTIIGALEGAEDNQVVVGGQAEDLDAAG